MLASDQNLGDFSNHSRREPFVMNDFEGVHELNGIAPQDAFGDMHLLRLESTRL